MHGKDEAEIEKLQMQLDSAEEKIVMLNERIQEKDSLINGLTRQNKQLKDDINRLLEAWWNGYSQKHHSTYF